MRIHFCPTPGRYAAPGAHRLRPRPEHRGRASLPSVYPAADGYHPAPERDHHILVQVGGPGVNIIELLPPLIIGDEEVDMIVSAFDKVMAEAASVRGWVWGMSAELIKHAIAP